MRRAFFASALFLLAACNPPPTVVAGASPNTVTPDVVMTPSLQSTPTLLPARVEASPTIQGEPTVSSNLWLQVTSPLDGDTLNIPQVDVTGFASAGAVVSVNDDILIVSNDQHFKATVVLEEGPNVIDIIASDDGGNENDVELTVFYEP